MAVLITDLAADIAVWAQSTVAPILDPDPVARIIYGDLSVDDCCPNDLVVVVGNILPFNAPAPNDCGQPWSVTISVVVSGCVATLDSRGKPVDAWPDMRLIVDAGQALYEDLCTLDVGDDWSIKQASLQPLGASGGCVSSVLTLLAWQM